MRFVVVLFALTSCYRPDGAGDSCNLRCATSDNCPNDLQCNSDGVCSTGGDPCEPGQDGGTTRRCAGSTSTDGLIGEVCFDPVPDPAVVGPQDLVLTDIGADPRCQTPITGDVNACVLIVDRIDAVLRAEGSRPLVLWSAGELVIAGEVDVASRAFNQPDLVGAAANDAACPAPGVIAGTKVNIDAGGGAGGSFGSKGGDGGSVPNTTGTGASAVGFTSQLSLRGGCRGGRGGDETLPAPENGGSSGGAVYLMAADRITVTGIIDASGAGATAPTKQSGGGGGGSGGLIGFEAESLDIAASAVVLAIGGGGSSGGAAAVGGHEGRDPTRGGNFAAVQTANGCSGVQNFGAAGGDGLSGPGNGGDGTAATGCAGGGGGGGDGVVRVVTRERILSGSVRPLPNPP